jgi:hypothetical protein
VISLKPGQTYKVRIDFAVHATASDVAAVEKRIAAIQKSATPQTHDQPVPKYAPV